MSIIEKEEYRKKNQNHFNDQNKKQKNYGI